MKTIGERIRQAREARGWSAFDLALKVGYKTQSGISNLENRATGGGGSKLGKIAQALKVPGDWLLNGPDSANVPFLEPLSTGQKMARYSTTLNEPETNIVPLDTTRSFDQWTLAAIAIMDTLDTGQRQAMVAKMREYKQFLGPPCDGQTLLVAK